MHEGKNYNNIKIITIFLIFLRKIIKNTYKVVLSKQKVNILVILPILTYYYTLHIKVYKLAVSITILKVYIGNKNTYKSKHWSIFCSINKHD